MAATSVDTPPVLETPEGPTFTERMLNGIERAGNRIPHPAMLFVWLIVIVIAVSQIMSWAGVKATSEVAAPPPAQAQQRSDYAGSQYPDYVLPPEQAQPAEYAIHRETIKAQGLLTGSGIRFIFTSFTKNFQEFTALTLILVVMIGVGLAEEAGLIAALVRKLVAVAPPVTLTFIIVLIGIVSSIASDAGYLVLIPLGAAAFYSVGRHPLAGIAAGFAGVSAGFGINFLITPTDAVVTGITNEAIHLVDPNTTLQLTHNLYFGIGSTILLTVLGAIVTTRIVERRLGRYDPAQAGEATEASDAEAKLAPAAEARGLRFALWGLLAVVGAITLLTVIPGAPLRNPETGSVISDSPFMESLVFIISVVFFVAGYAFGRGAGTIKTSTDVINKITKQWGTLVGLLFLFLLIAQFLAYFSHSNIPALAAVGIGHALEHVHIPAVWLLILFIGIVTVVNLIMSGLIAKWALLAPIFIPVFLTLKVHPAAVVAAYRVGDSPTNVLTPAMAYFPLIVIFMKRWQKDAGIGTLITMMLPYALVFTVVWTAFFVVWYLLGIPLGPGAGVHL